jgi:hypothetical protein
VSNDVNPAWELLQALLSQREEGRTVLRQLEEDPDAGLAALTQYLSSEKRPPEIANHVSGGNIDKLVNIARAQTVNVFSGQANLTKEYAMDRLTLGFNSFLLRSELAANNVHPDRYPYPTQRLAEFISTVNETFHVSLGTPPGPIVPGDFVNYFMQRMRPSDAVGAAIFRLGGDLSSWWQTKGIHGAEMDSLLEQNVKEALGELEVLRPHSSRRIQEIMNSYRHRDTATPNDHLTREFLGKVAVAIVSLAG